MHLKEDRNERRADVEEWVEPPLLLLTELSKL
jgi:hypothetical protein